MQVFWSTVGKRTDPLPNWCNVNHLTESLAFEDALCSKIINPEAWAGTLVCDTHYTSCVFTNTGPSVYCLGLALDPDKDTEADPGNSISLDKSLHNTDWIHHSVTSKDLHCECRKPVISDYHNDRVVAQCTSEWKPVFQAGDRNANGQPAKLCSQAWQVECQCGHVWQVECQHQRTSSESLWETFVMGLYMHVNKLDFVAKFNRMLCWSTVNFLCLYIEKKTIPSPISESKVI